MIGELSQYLESVRDNLRLDLIAEREVLSELQAHIEDKLDEMKKAGLSEEEATNTCLALLGSAKMVARQIYEAHSQGTWKQALLASIPHLLFALLFVLNWWQGVGWLVLTAGLILVIALYGWFHSRPVWILSWLSCSLLPVIVAGVLLLYLPESWSWVAVAVYVTLALRVVYAVTIKTIRRDWLYGALMLLPIPIIMGWFLAIGKEGELFQSSLEYIRYFAPCIGLSFLALAATTVAFIRLRQRWLKVVLLFMSGLLSLIMVAYYAEGGISFSVFLVLSLVMAGFLLGPALVERRLKPGKGKSVT